MDLGVIWSAACGNQLEQLKFVQLLLYSTPTLSSSDLMRFLH